MSLNDIYIEELKFIAAELSAAFFTLQCLYAYHIEELPSVEGCSEEAVEHCWRSTRDNISQQLSDFTQIIGFLEESGSTAQPIPPS